MNKIDLKGRCAVVIIIQLLHPQRHRVRLTGDMARDDRHCAELAHGAGVAKQDSVKQAPLDVWKGDAQENLPAARAKCDSGFFLITFDVTVGPLFFIALDSLPGHSTGAPSPAGDNC